MTMLLLAIIVVLLMVIAWQYASRRALHTKLYHMSQKLSHIIEQESAEKLLMLADSKEHKELLIQINRLLDYNQKIAADYARTKESLKKMMSNMSHDMKTPLTVILGYAEKLNHDQGLTEEQRAELVKRLHDKIEDLIALLNQFFELAKLEASDYTMTISRICISELCRKSVLEYYDLLQAKQLHVDIDIPEQNLYMLGNADAITRILNNLISNSLRYGSDGGVFGLTLREVDDKVEFEIWDRGKGIDEVHQSHVFDRLYTLDDARNPLFRGSGLGLSITKQLTEAMKGTIRLQSKPYDKTSFTCSFPRMNY